MVKVLLLVIALALVPPAAAGAAVIATAALSSGTADDVVCQATNVSNGDIEIMLEAVNAIGIVGATNSGTVQPGVTMAAVDTTPAPSYCRVTGTPAKKVRLSLCMRSTTGDCIAVATAP